MRFPLQVVLLLVFCVALVAQGARADEPAAEASQREKASPPAADVAATRTLGILLYRDFELLDVYGPAEVFGNVGRQLKVVLVAEQAGPVVSAQGLQSLAEFGFDNCPKLDLLLVPGGRGTIRELRNKKLHEWLQKTATDAELVMSVCTGSGILARAGLLDGLRATTNKQNFAMMRSTGSKVEWVAQARWVDAGKFVTSSGVTAGIDMSLHVVERLFGDNIATRIADGIEHQWQRDPTNDPFARFVKEKP